VAGIGGSPKSHDPELTIERRLPGELARPLWADRPKPFGPWNRCWKKPEISS